MSKLPIDIALSQQLLYLNLAEQELLIQKNRAAILELLLRKSKNEINIEAAKKYIGEQEKLVINRPIEIQKRKMEIAGQNATIERQILENLEGDERIERCKDNIEIAINAQLQITKNLEDLEQAHTNLVENYFK